MVISRISSVVMTEQQLHGHHAPHRVGHHEAAMIHAAGNVRSMLREAGLRPTRQRLALAEILYSKGNRHISAEQLHEEALTARVPVSLATVYNTLHQFTEAGLLREVAVDGTKTYFDTNTSDHHHFFLENENSVIDIPGDGLRIDDLPQPPADMEIVRVDVVVRVRPKRS